MRENVDVHDDIRTLGASPARGRDEVMPSHTRKRYMYSAEPDIIDGHASILGLKREHFLKPDFVQYPNTLNPKP